MVEKHTKEIYYSNWVSHWSFYYLSNTSSHLVAEASHQDKHTDIRQVSEGIGDCSHRCSLCITGYLPYDRKASFSLNTYLKLAVMIMINIHNTTNIQSP